MRHVAIDMTGLVVGLLTVLGRAGTGKDKRAMWSVRCECGTVLVVTGKSLRSGNTRTCGCSRRDPRVAPEPAPVHGARWVPLSKGFFALVDEADYEAVSAHYWSAGNMLGGHPYPCRRVDGDAIYLHRVLARAGPSDFVDHINGDILNNRRANLRLCTKKENLRNRRKRAGCLSPYKGVVRTRGGRWEARVTVDGKAIYAGSYATDADAARAYDAAALKHFGAFARLNFGGHNG